MPSSISNSNSRAPDGPYLKIWLTTIVLVIVMAGAAELYWRSKDQLPDVSDDLFLWSYMRSQVYSQDRLPVIALVGGSRIQLGVVPEILEQRFPGYPTIHLAVVGKSGYAVFEDLAKDPDFNGLIVLSATAAHFFPSSQIEQKPWVDYYHEQWSSFSRIEKYINMKARIFFQKRLVIFSDRLNLRSQLMNKFYYLPSHLQMVETRYRAAFYYDSMSSERLAAYRQNRIDRISDLPQKDPPLPERQEEFEQIMLTQVSPLVAELRSHGGEVIFLRMPTCDEHWEIDEIRFPKELFWDQISSLTHANTIHFKDVEGLSNFDCPDTSHLDATDAPVFTDRLADEIKKVYP